MKCRRCNLEFTEAEVLSAAARIQVGRRKNAGRNGGRHREMPDCPHCGKAFGRLAAVESHRCPRLEGKHPEALTEAAARIRRQRKRAAK